MVDRVSAEPRPSGRSGLTLEWEICKPTPTRTVVRLRGLINEHFDSGSLLGALKRRSGQIVLDCEGIARISSEGIHRWVRFLRALASREVEIVYARCSVAVVAQLNMVRDFHGPASVESVFAPYICEATDEEGIRLINLADLKDLKVPPVFEDGERTWELDEIPDRYFAFALDPAD